MAYTRVLIPVIHKKYLNNAATIILTNLKPSIAWNIKQCTHYSDKKNITRVHSNETENKVQVGLAEVVKENTKSAGYFAVIVGGMGITIFMFYAIFRELFSSKSPNGVYTKALERCIKDNRIKDALGEPIKAYGEESRRGRRTHVSHGYFMKDGIEHMRMQFYIQGIRRKGTVYLEVQESASGDYEYKYLYVKIDDVTGSVIKLEDNTNNTKNVKSHNDNITYELN